LTKSPLSSYILLLMPKISAVIIAKNEEHSIGRTLASLDFCDEVIVVDSGSMDSTLSICEKFNCKVFTRAFDGYGPQKQFAVSKANNDWVLSIDADEVVSDGLKKEIVNLFASATPDAHGYFIPISLVFLGRLMRFGGEYKNAKLRLFNKTVGTFSASTVHEHVIITGKTASLKNNFLHYSYKSLHEYIDKFNHYTTAAAISMNEKGKKISVIDIALRLPLTFFKIYVLKGAILEGYPGLMWALLSGLYPLIKYAKLRELQTASGNASLSDNP
jgi:glycosyltransferase involved in cell wall biosynthesis